MTGSAITIVLLTDHPASVGTAHDCATQAAEWLQRSSGYPTAVAIVDALDIDPNIFPTAEEALALKHALSNAVVDAASAPSPAPATSAADSTPVVEPAPVAADPVVEVVPAAENPAPVTTESVPVESTEAAPGGTADEATSDVVPAPTTEQAPTTEATSTDTPVAQQEPTPVTAEPPAETEPAAAPEPVVPEEVQAAADTAAVADTAAFDAEKAVADLEAAHAAAEVADAAEADAEKAVEDGVSGVLDNPTA